MSNTRNPLKSYFRQPELFISLPSKGKWWGEGLEMPENKEVPILALTGKDEIVLKSPDGLMNGSSLASVLESCCPSIKNAWACPVIDIDKLFISIKLASYGDAMDIDFKCTKCEEESSFGLSLSKMMDQIKYPDYSKPMLAGQLEIFFRPASLADQNRISQEEYTQQKTIISLTESNLDDEKKVEYLKKALDTLTNITVSALSMYVDYIVTPEGDRISDKEFIDEYIMNTDQKTFNQLKEFIKNKNEEFKAPVIDIVCPKCNNKHSEKFEFNPSNFFGKGY